MLDNGRRLVVLIVICFLLGGALPEAFAQANLPLQISGKLELITMQYPFPMQRLMIKTEEGEVYFLLGRLVNRLRELVEEIEALQEETVVVVGQKHPAEVRYKKKDYPTFHVTDYALPQIEGIDLGKEENIKLELKGE